MKKPPANDTDACAEGNYGAGLLAVLVIVGSVGYAGYVIIEWMIETIRLWIS